MELTYLLSSSYGEGGLKVFLQLNEGIDTYMIDIWFHKLAAYIHRLTRNPNSFVIKGEEQKIILVSTNLSTSSSSSWCEP